MTDTFALIFLGVFILIVVITIVSAFSVDPNPLLERPASDEDPWFSNRNYARWTSSYPPRNNHAAAASAAADAESNNINIIVADHEPDSLVHPMNSSRRSSIQMSPQRVSMEAPLSPSPPPTTPQPSITPLLSKRKSSSMLVTPPSSPERKIRRLHNPETELPLNSQIEDTPQWKLKPEERAISSDHEEEMDSSILNEKKFVGNDSNSHSEVTTRAADGPSPSQVNRILDPNKSQGIANLLRVQRLTSEEVCEALLDGSTNALDVEILRSLLKFAPNKEEECEFKGYRDDSPIKLDPAERFLRALLVVPFAFKRIEVLFYITNFNTQVEFLMKSYESIKAVCKELRNNSTFLKLLDVVLKAGISHGDAHACKFDTLLELISVKATDQRSTLLRMAVKDICSRFCPSCKRMKLDLQAVTSLSSELTKVKKAATIDFNDLSSYASDLFKGIKNVEDVKRWNEAMPLDKSSKIFSHSMKGFTQKAEEEIARIQAQESSALSLVKEIIEHFNENPAEEEAHPFKIFIALKEFLSVLDQICKEILMSHN